jgi:hypothetical protein
MNIFWVWIPPAALAPVRLRGELHYTICEFTCVPLRLPKEIIHQLHTVLKLPCLHADAESKM